MDDAVAEFLRNPSKEAFGAVFHVLYAPLCRYFAVRGLDASVAEDLVQEVLVTVYRRANDVRDPSCFRGWLFRVAKNALLQHVRKYRGEFESLDKDDWFSHGSDQRHFTFKPQEESALYDWMEALEPDEREICILRYVDDLEYQTIADALQIPIGTVKWKLHRIKNKIAIRLGYSGPGLKS